MPTLREVTTRFKFETDKKGVDKFERTMKRMRGGTRRLAKLFGITLGVAGITAMGKLGVSIERARFNMERFSGVNTRQLNQQLKGVQVSLDAIRQGFGSKITDKNFFTAGTEFFKVFGKGEGQMEAFRRTFELAAKLSLLTGKNVDQLFSSITQGIESGNFGFLADIPGFTKTRIQNLQDQLNAIAPGGEFTSGIGRAQRLNAFLRNTGRSSGVINKNLRAIPDAVFEADQAAANFKKTMDNLAQSVTKLLVPALNKLNILLDKIVVTSDEVKKNGFIDAFGKPAIATARAIGVPEDVVKASVGASKLTRNILNAVFNINVTANGNQQIANEVEKVVSGVIKKASRELVQTEDR